MTPSTVAVPTQVGPADRGGRLAPVLLFANHSGGSIKTTCADCIAAEAARRGLKVLLLDFNYQGDSSHVCGFPLPDNLCIHCDQVFAVVDFETKEEEETDLRCDVNEDGRHEAMITLYDSLLNEDDFPIDHAIHPAVTADGTAVPNLWIGVASEQLTSAESQLKELVGWEQVVVRILRKVRREYDLVVIDGPGQYGALLRALYVAATSVIACVKPGLKEVKHLGRMTRTIKKINERIRPDEPVALDAIIIGDVFPSTQGRAYGEMVEVVRKMYGSLVTPTVRHAVLVPEAFARKVLVSLYMPDSPVAKDYIRVYDDLVDRELLPRGNPDGAVSVETISEDEMLAAV